MKEKTNTTKKEIVIDLTNLQSSFPIEALIILQFPLRVDSEFKTVLKDCCAPARFLVNPTFYVVSNNIYE